MRNQQHPAHGFGVAPFQRPEQRAVKAQERMDQHLIPSLPARPDYCIRSFAQSIAGELLPLANQL
jgi:hypothetical protein